MARPKKPLPSHVTVECIIHNVHLGDGRELNRSDRAEVAREIAEFLEGRKQVKIL